MSYIGIVSCLSLSAGWGHTTLHATVRRVAIITEDGAAVTAMGATGRICIRSERTGWIWTTQPAAVRRSCILKTEWATVATLCTPKFGCVRWWTTGGVEWTTTLASEFVSECSIRTTTVGVVWVLWWIWATLWTPGCIVVCPIRTITKTVTVTVAVAETSIFDSNTANDDDDDESYHDSSDGQSTRDAIQPTSWHDVANRCLLLAYNCEI